MAINFCFQPLGTEITCSVPSTDNYEVENLISPQNSNRRRGFMAEYFVKPPVEIIISFPISIEICCIDLWLKKELHQIKGLEIWTSKDLSGDFTKLIQQNNISSHTVSFKNRFYHPKGKFNMFPLPSLNGDGEVCSIRSLASVQRIKFRLFRVAGTGVVCLPKCQVWGQAMPSCSKEIINKLLDVVRAYNTQQTPELPVNTADKKDEPERAPLEPSGDDIPSDFFDALTCELMVQPVLLPSGQIVDSQTLEKHNKQEEHWGRAPSDPFTGIPFRNNYKPTFLTVLKSRIDDFIVKNPHKFGNIPRTVGTTSSQQAFGPKKSSLIAPDGNCSVNTKRTLEKSEESSPMIKKSRIACISGSDAGGSTENHEERLSSSLQDALGSVLSSVRKRKEAKEALSAACVFCNNTSPSYSLPCGHLLCRLCLTKGTSQTVRCTPCQKLFTSSDICRIHR